MNDRPPTFTYIRAKFPWRAAIYAAVILYLFADLYWLGGPLSRFINGYTTRQAEEEGWVAQVYGSPVTRQELDHAVTAHLFRRGETLENFSAEARFAVQIRVLEELVEHKIIATWSRHEAVPGADEAAVDSELARFRKHFTDATAFSEALAAQNLDPGGLRDLIAKRVRTTAWIESKIARATEVTDDDVRAYFDANRHRLNAPEAVRARHIFLAADTGDRPDRGPEIRRLHGKLATGKRPFADLASTVSEDPRSKNLGGDLGFFTRHRMPDDFVAAVWPLPVGETSPPFRTNLGWHIAEVTDKAPARPLTFDEAAPEIRAHLESQRRTTAIEELKSQIHQRTKNNVAYYYHVLVEKSPQTTDRNPKANLP